jgi:hypothetical protein
VVCSRTSDDPSVDRGSYALSYSESAYRPAPARRGPSWYLQGEALATVIELSLAAASLSVRPAAPAWPPIAPSIGAVPTLT